MLKKGKGSLKGKSEHNRGIPVCQIGLLSMLLLEGVLLSWRNLISRRDVP